MANEQAVRRQYDAAMKTVRRCELAIDRGRGGGEDVAAIEELRDEWAAAADRLRRSDLVVSTVGA